jgi:peptide/nickel transport system permease protein
VIESSSGVALEGVAAGRTAARPTAWRRHRMLWVGLAIVAFWVVVAVGAPLFSPYAPNAPDMAVRLTGPSAAHLLGTDEYGRDILTRIFYGARLSMLVAVSSTFLALAVGVPLGLFAGYRAGLPAEAVMRVMDIFLAFPSLVLALAIGAAIGPGLTGEVMAITLVTIPVFARQAQAQTAAIKNLLYVESARAAGSGFWRLVRRHLLPNMFAPVLVVATLNLGFAVLTGASLSFLGLGVQPPTPEWGSMVSDGSQYLVSGQWWTSLFPGLAIMSVVFAFNVAGDGLRDFMDPRARHRAGGAGEAEPGAAVE